jgi:hypothetical protein
MINYDFTQYRTVLGFQKSKRYLKWMKSCYPYVDLHHILGSVHGIKFTDYLVVPVEHGHHLNVIEPHKGIWFNKLLERSITYLAIYAKSQLGMDSREIKSLLPNFEPESIKTFIEVIYKKENN